MRWAPTARITASASSESIPASSPRSAWSSSCVRAPRPSSATPSAGRSSSPRSICRSGAPPPPTRSPTSSSSSPPTAPATSAATSCASTAARSTAGADASSRDGRLPAVFAPQCPRYNAYPNKKLGEETRRMSFKALLLEEKDGKVSGAVTSLDDAKLPPGDVTVAVEYTTLNYKDGLILANKARLVRQFPHIPGIDF